MRPELARDSWSNFRRAIALRFDEMAFKALMHTQAIADAAFPNPVEGRLLSICMESESGYYTANGLRLVKAKVERLSRVKFKLKDFRSTLTSVTVNGDMSRLPAMSVQLRHASVTTTQRSYYAMERGVAGRQLRNAWKEHPIVGRQNPVIELKERLPGY